MRSLARNRDQSGANNHMAQSILIKNIATNEIIKFDTKKECCTFLGVDYYNLKKLGKTKEEKNGYILL